MIISKCAVLTFLGRHSFIFCSIFTFDESLVPVFGGGRLWMEVFTWIIVVDCTAEQPHLLLANAAHGQPKTHKSAEE
jgi:hypothetical protein